MELVRTTIALLLVAILCCAASCALGINDCGDKKGSATPINLEYYATLQSSLAAFTSGWCDGDGNHITSRYNPKQKAKSKEKSKSKQKPQLS